MPLNTIQLLILMGRHLLLLLLIPAFCLSQTRPVIKGRVISGISGVKDVLVINNNAQAETRTDSLGNFSIKAATGDLFVISDYKVQSKKIRFTPDQVSNNTFIINVVMTATELEEIVITRSNITAESLGLVPKNQKRYTTNERRLKTGGGGPITSIEVGTYMSFGLDGLMNAISGRMKALKQNVLTERKIMLIEKVQTLYTDDQIMEEFKIPREYIQGFLYYIPDDAELRETLSSNNKSRIKFVLGGLAVKYLEILNAP